MMYYINKLEQLEKLCEKVPLTDERALSQEFHEARAMCVELVTKALQQGNDNDLTFFKICQQYPCDLTEVLTDLQETYPFVNIEKEADSLGGKDFPLAISTDIFKGILEELINNAARVCSEGVGNITIKYQCAMEGVFFKIIQTHSYKPKKRDGGLTNNVKYFLEKFAADYGDNDLESLKERKPFIIDIKVNYHAYKN
jgi:hypothetical protein